MSVEVLPRGGDRIMENIVCSKCSKEISQSQPGAITTGYGVDANGGKICYSCCADIDRADMVGSGRATLYLSAPSIAQPHRVGRVGYVSSEGWSITNWPGSLEFVPRGMIGISRTNWGLERIDVWFAFDGFVWHGKNIGDSQILHCKRTKQPSQSQPIPRVHYIGMAGLCGYMPSAYFGPSLYRGDIAQSIGDLHELSDRKIKRLRRDWYIDLNLHVDGNEYGEIVECACGKDYDDCPNADDSMMG